MSKDTYFEELAAWKAQYKALSEEIREWKRNMKDGDYGRPWYAQSQREACRTRASNMMEIRTELKERARAHWAAQTTILEMA